MPEIGGERKQGLLFLLSLVSEREIWNLCFHEASECLKSFIRRVLGGDGVVEGVRK